MLQMMAMALVAGGVVCGAIIILTTRNWHAAAGAGLELWLAAGLLRLAGPPSWQGIAMAAALIAVRRLLRSGHRVLASNPAAGSRT
ncbi:MAG: hypothetical protein WD178_04715 [Actinomycetota bacterium]